jgi:16S rRNA processing protein RimM
MPHYFKIGKFVAAHGIGGDLILQHSLGKKTSLKGLECVYIEEQKESFIPYFIEKTKIRSEEETLIKIEHFGSRESVKKFTSKEVWIEEADFKKHAESSAPIALLGYQLYDGDEELGKVIEVIEQPHQVLCVIIYKGNEAYIPVHEETLIKMDKKNKKLYLDIPGGLLDVYGGA